MDTKIPKLQQGRWYIMTLQISFYVFCLSVIGRFYYSPDEPVWLINIFFYSLVGIFFSLGVITSIKTFIHSETHKLSIYPLPEIFRDERDKTTIERAEEKHCFTLPGFIFYFISFWILIYQLYKSLSN